MTPRRNCLWNSCGLPIGASTPGIYSRLTECLGVEIGVIDRDGNVYVGTGGGRVFNAALHSPFMRLVDQPVDPRERQNIKRIRTGATNHR